MFLTFTTTKSGFGNDLEKSLCKFMVGKNLRIVAQWWTLRERHFPFETFIDRNEIYVAVSQRQKGIA